MERYWFIHMTETDGEPALLSLTSGEIIELIKAKKITEYDYAIISHTGRLVKHFSSKQTFWEV